MSILARLLQYVLLTTSKYNIDETHGLGHSIDVLCFADKIYTNQLRYNPDIQSQQKIIYVSAILHDMCDKKYVDEKAGLRDIEHFLQDTLTPVEIDISSKIISSMSYSTVKKQGYPDLGIYQDAYHIVRQADLLSAYDFDRCIMYQMYKHDCDINGAFDNAIELFNNRVLMHNRDGLFLTDYTKSTSMCLHKQALTRIRQWQQLLTKSALK